MQQNIDMDTKKYTIISNGDSSFVKNVSIPLCKSLESLFKSEGWQHGSLPDHASFQIDSEPKADSALVAGLIGIVFFISSKMASKLWDEIYKLKIQPKLQEVLKKVDKKLTGANKRKQKFLQSSIWYQDLEVFIVVLLKDDTYKEITKQLSLIKHVQKNALTWVQDNGVVKPIHLYLIENGSVNLEPKLFDNLMEANRLIGK